MYEKGIVYEFDSEEVCEVGCKGGEVFGGGCGNSDDDSGRFGSLFGLGLFGLGFFDRGFGFMDDDK